MHTVFNISDYEIMAPAGSYESLSAAIQAGADSVYFGVGRLNMRSNSAGKFTIDELVEITKRCSEHGIKSYLTLNAIIYDDDIALMQRIVDEACKAKVSAVIASDIAVMEYCRHAGMEVHLSTQLNVSNIEALKFYSRFAEVAVLARELALPQVENICRHIAEENICGPSGRHVRIEMFCHGALCMAVSGKCYLSLDNMNRSANRGECMQLCRRGKTVTDNETGAQLEIASQNVMSPKDLKTIRLVDRMMAAGVKIFKIEGRARGPEYVYNVTACYREAVKSICEGSFTEEKKAQWDERLAKVFNRGFWDGKYLGQKLGEWNNNNGSNATEKQVYCGKGVNYFPRIGVAEFAIEAAELHKGDRLLITGPTTGVVYTDASEIRYELQPVDKAEKGWRVSIPVPEKVRPSDKLFILVSNQKNT